ncbi:MAG: hypothetical protein U1E83_03095 [Methylotetracoccus sp.]
MFKPFTRITCAVVMSAGIGGTASAHMYTQFPAWWRGGLPKATQWEAVYQDGAWGPVYMNIGHACGHTEVMASSPRTTQVAVVVPGNNWASQVIDYPLLDGSYEFPPLDKPYRVIGPASPDASGYDWGISTAQAEGIPALNRTYQFYAEASPVYDKAPRATVWVGDQGIGGYSIGQVVLWVQLPEIPKKSCVTDVQYFFAAAQFCPKSNLEGALPAQAWLLGTTSTWSDQYVGGAPYQWAPYLRMTRDLKAKPLPKSCGGKGQVVSVYASSDDIDAYLRPVVESKSGDARQISLEQWVRQNQ